MKTKRHATYLLLLLSILMLGVPVIPHHHHADGVLCMKNDVHAGCCTPTRTLLLRHGMHLHPLLPATARHQPGHSPTAILRHVLPAGGAPGSTCSIPPFRTFPTNLVGLCRIPSRHATHTCHGASCTSCIPLLNLPYPNPTSILQPGCAGSTITLCDIRIRSIRQIRVQRIICVIRVICVPINPINYHLTSSIQ